MLVGGFVQIDLLSQDSAITGTTAGGTGWLARPYITARLGENLYLDLLAAGGRAENQINPLGSYEDAYGSTRFLTSATLQGDFVFGPGMRHAFDMGNGVTIGTNLRLDAVATYSNSLATPSQTDLHGRVSAGLDFGFNGGANLGLLLTHDGLFGSARSTAVRPTLRAPIN